MGCFTHRMASAALVTGLLVGSVGTADAGVTISTLGSENGTVSAFGTPDSGSTPTYGETFIDPAGNGIIQSITFRVNDNNPNPLPFRASVYAYNTVTNMLVGSALYTSTTLSIAPSPNILATVTVSGINTLLTPGNSYIALFSTIGLTGPVGGATYGIAPDGSYTGGTFVFNNATTATGLATTSFSRPTDFGFPNNFDLSFALTFDASPPTTATPEPATFALGVTGVLAGLAALRRRKMA